MMREGLRAEPVAADDFVAQVDARTIHSMPPPPALAGSAGDELRAPSVLDQIRHLDLVFLCAEPGMGKSHLASELLKEATAEGRRAHRYSFDAPSADVACQKIVRCCRDLIRRKGEGSRPLVVMDGVAPPDECESHSEAHALRRLRSHGFQVLVCLRPEAEQLAECVGDAPCLRSEDLLFRAPSEASEAYGLTAGIPQLAVALRSGADARSGGARLGARYLSSMEALVASALRSGLTDEETRIRLAMVLLGSGTLEEVALVAGRCGIEDLVWLQRDVPLLGASAHERTFHCAGLSRDSVLLHCLGSLHGLASFDPALVVRACGVLATRGDVCRSALVCRLCASERDFASVVLRWAVPYASVGELRLVDEGLRAGKRLGFERDVRWVLGKTAFLCLEGTGKDVDHAWERLESVRLGSVGEQRLYEHVTFLGLCRDVWRQGARPLRRLHADPSDTLGLACLDHARLAGLLLSGRFHEAYSSLTNEVCLRGVRTVPEALLCDDQYLGLALCGGAPDVREAALFDEGRRFSQQVGLGRMRVYHEAIEAIPHILMGASCEAARLEEAASRAEHAGDALMQAVCIAVCAVADIRSRAFSRAHVRAEKAAAMSRALGERYLCSASELVDAVSVELLGETGALAGYCRDTDRPDGLMLLARCAALALGETVEAGPMPDIPLGVACPRNDLWALNMLLNDCPGMRDELHGVVPPTWVELMRAIRARQSAWLGAEGGDERRERALRVEPGAATSLRNGEQTELLPVGSTQCRIRLSVLGGFRAEVDGRPMPGEAFDRRQARDLLALLVVSPKHKFRRYRAIEILWQDCDYYRGLRKLYEATSEARKRLGGADAINPLISDRVQGTIGLDVSLVSCDVDEFEEEARMALAEDGDDFWVIDHARRMGRLYGSGPDEHLSLLGQPVVDRLEELAALYVDGTVAAGEAALRLGKTKLATRFATDACRCCELREDAVILLVRALKASGRAFEIPPLYRRHCQRALDERGTLPSTALRRAVELACGEDGLDVSA